MSGERSSLKFRSRLVTGTATASQNSLSENIIVVCHLFDQIHDTKLQNQRDMSPVSRSQLRCCCDCLCRLQPCSACNLALGCVGLEQQPRVCNWFAANSRGSAVHHRAINHSLAIGLLLRRMRGGVTGGALEGISVLYISRTTHGGVDSGPQRRMRGECV